MFPPWQYTWSLLYNKSITHRGFTQQLRTPHATSAFRTHTPLPQFLCAPHAHQNCCSEVPAQHLNSRASQTTSKDLSRHAAPHRIGVFWACQPIGDLQLPTETSHLHETGHDIHYHRLLISSTDLRQRGLGFVLKLKHQHTGLVDMCAHASVCL